MKQDPEHGPLPALLAGLTLITGFIDAVTYLKYGHVFVANMTGNIVLLGFAVAGDSTISIKGTLLAFGGFFLGAFTAGWLNWHLGSHRGNLLSVSTLVKVIVLLSATVAAAIGANPLVVIPLLGVTMGIQNAVVRKLAIPDITTTVLTMTLTGIMADSSLVGGKNPRLARRVLAVITMFLGALGGGASVLYSGVPLALGMATLIVAVVGIAAFITSRDNPAWVAAT